MTAAAAPGKGMQLFDLASGLVVIGALVYATGWTYAHRYFGCFNLGLLMLDIPARYFFMYGFWVFKAWWWLWGLFLLAGLAILVVRGRSGSALPWPGRLSAGLLSLVLVLITLAGFFLAAGLASLQAEKRYLAQQQSGFQEYPHVRVWPRAVPAEERAGNPVLEHIVATLPEGGYQLLLQNATTLFLFKVPDDGKAVRPAVLQLPLARVLALRILP